MINQTITPNLYKSTLKNIYVNRERIVSGKVNCIPWGLPRFEQYNPGIEKGKYYIVTANSKVGKTQLTDFLFVYNPINFVLNRNDLDVQIYYFTLEMSPQEKMLQAMSHLIYKKYNKIVTPRQLMSKRSELPKDVLDIIIDNEAYFDAFLSKIQYIEISNYTGIDIFLKKKIKELGTEYKKEIDTDKGKINVLTQYVPHDPEKYVIVIIDHASILKTETKQGSLKRAINDVSHMLKDYRNRYNITPVLVQQQANAQEGIENFKHNKLRPSLNGLSDSKDTGRDANTVFGLFAPHRHEIPQYAGYNVLSMKDRLRFLEIIASREGNAGSLLPLEFYGECSIFTELPTPDKVDYDKYLCL